jgi:flavin reductase (DIM6/NTAB) family NADH-FMN oxidoreductase RutF
VRSASTTEADPPRLHGTSAWLVTGVDSAVPAGDHVLLVLRVHATTTSGALPLAYARRSCGTHSAQLAAPDSATAARSPSPDG